MAINSTKLSTGLTVATCKIPYVKSVVVNVTVGVGSRYERPEESGISHFLEHMAFKQTKNRTTRQIAEEFDAIGGISNAYTSKEHTAYYAKVLSEELYTACDILADITQNSLYDATDISKEYQVICQEIAQTNDSPDDLAFENLYNTAFSKQAFGSSILGTKEGIAKFKQDSFKEYVSEHYSADNIIISAAGDVEHDKFVEYVEKLFKYSKIDKKEAKGAIYTPGSNIYQKDLEQSTLILAFESVSYHERIKFFHAQMLSLILGGGLSSRLFQRIRENSGLAYSVGSFNSSYQDTGLFSLYAGTDHDKLSDVTTQSIEEIHKIKSEVADEELKRAKAQVKANILMAEEKPAYKAEEIAKSFSIFGEYEGVDKVLNIIENTSIDDIENIAKQIFSTKPTLSVVTSGDCKLKYDQLCKDLV